MTPAADPEMGALITSLLRDSFAAGVALYCLVRLDRTMTTMRDALADLAAEIARLRDARIEAR